MGNAQSRRGLEIEKKALEVTDFWSLFNAEISNDGTTTLLSIFQAEPFVSGQLWVNISPLERATKNLMIYRHPCILKYYSSWEKGSQKQLATERCKPLSLVVQTQSDIQICLGLKNILCSLIFLVEQAKARHLNLSTSSIYLTPDGAWRLGGFEYVWKAKEVSSNLLDRSRSYRYKKAIDSNESKVEGQGIEQYAFAVLCDEILKNHKNEGTPYISEFRDYCATHLKHQNIAMRPKLSAVLLHPYFNHEFILIHSFLIELPLKSPQEKQDFFTGLVDRLRYFDEIVVASQLGGLLLSRMVLLHTTAQLCVTPYVLKTKTELSAALFSGYNFTKYIIPKIKQIFFVRDAQIRLILLEYFNEYVNLFTKEELQDQILPNLLLGIKDTNDILVAKTLRCLADLVPFLGSAVVIGGNRGRLFADGRPQGLPDCTSHWVEPRSITPVMTSDEYIASASPLPETADVSESYLSVGGNTENILMPERLSPDGGEDVQNATDSELEEEEAWSDWENDETRLPIDNLSITNSGALIMEPEMPLQSSTQHQETDNKLNENKDKTLTIFIEDINELDIKNKKFTPPKEQEEFDFFKDMEPVIETSKNPLIPDENEINIVKIIKNDVAAGFAKPDIKVDESRFEIKVQNEMCEEAGWDDGTNDW